MKMHGPFASGQFLPAYPVIKSQWENIGEAKSKNNRAVRAAGAGAGSRISQISVRIRQSGQHGERQRAADLFGGNGRKEGSAVL